LFEALSVGVFVLAAEKMVAELITIAADKSAEAIILIVFIKFTLFPIVLRQNAYADCAVLL
jgi:hypothetical protein